MGKSADWSDTTILDKPGVDTLRTQVEHGHVSNMALLQAVCVLTEWVNAHRVIDPEGAARACQDVAHLLGVADTPISRQQQ